MIPARRHMEQTKTNGHSSEKKGFYNKCWGQAMSLAPFLKKELSIEEKSFIIKVPLPNKKG